MSSVLESPVVAIGLPVYNGAAHIGQAPGALLEQTIPNGTLADSDTPSEY